MRTFNLTTSEHLSELDKVQLNQLYLNRHSNPIIYINDFLCHYVFITDEVMILGLMVVMGEPDDRFILYKIKHNHGAIMSDHFEVVKEVKM